MSGTAAGDLREILAAAFRALPLAEPAPDARARQLDQLVTLVQTLERWRARMNLTGHRGEEAIARRLVVDALALWAHVRPLVAGPPAPLPGAGGADPAPPEVGPAPRQLVDLGSGAGFPGLPIAILEPSCHVILVDARERRHHFQRAARRALSLDNVEPLLGRIESLPARGCSVVVAQALAAPPQVAAWGLRWLQPGGHLIIPGSETPPDPGPLTGFAERGEVHYTVPLGGPDRSLFWARRSNGSGN